MAGGTRELKRRIKSVASTQKVTKAMEMVAASKMRRAIASVLATRDYSNLAWATIMNLAQRTDSALHPLLAKKDKVENVCLILVSSNRGLCGGFNMQVVQKAINSIKKHEENVKVTDVITMGTKGRDIIRGFKFNVAADFKKQDLTLRVADVYAVAHLIIKDFTSGKYDKVFVAFTDFVSTLKQEPRVKQLLPIDQEPDEYLGVVGKSSGVGTTKKFIQEKAEKYLKKGEYSYEYVFEPNAKTVLEEMLPRLIETQIYQAVLESEASEHSARMFSMRNASEAASDMISDLSLSYNRARQAGITQEIAEISSAAESLKK